MLTTGTIKRLSAPLTQTTTTAEPLAFMQTFLDCRAVRKNSGGTWYFARFGDFSGLSHKIKVEIGADTPEERRRNRFKSGRITVNVFLQRRESLLSQGAKKKAFTSYRKFLTKSIVKRNPARASDRKSLQAPKCFIIST
jgi:hypothetical protein